MKTAEQRIVELEKENTKLTKSVHQLLRRIQIIEQRANSAYHTARLNESRLSVTQRNVDQVQRTLRSTNV